MNSKRALFFYTVMMGVSMGATFACGDDGESTDEGTGGKAAADAGEGGEPSRPTGGKVGSGGSKASGGSGAGGEPDGSGTGGASPEGGRESTGGRETTGGKSGGGGNSSGGTPASGGTVSGPGGAAGSGGDAGAGPIDPECDAGFYGPSCQPCACPASRCDDGIDGDGSCACPTGFTGPNCDRCAPGFQDRDDDGTCEEACAPNTCNGHGTCDDSLGEIRCLCTKGYTGSRCAQCAEGYQDNDDNTTCLRACDEDTCNDHGTCDDDDGTVGCECSGGYTGAFCDNCPGGEQDNDDNGTCLPACSESTCSGTGDCDDEDGTAGCTCDTGYAGEACDECDEGYQDNDDNDTCELACDEGSCSPFGTCVDDDGPATCECDEGYAGETCAECDEGYQDKDENDTCEPACAEGSCSGHGTCDDADGTLACACDEGYIGDACEICDDGWVPVGDICEPT